MRLTWLILTCVPVISTAEDTAKQIPDEWAVVMQRVQDQSCERNHARERLAALYTSRALHAGRPYARVPDHIVYGVDGAVRAWPPVCEWVVCRPSLGPTSVYVSFRPSQLLDINEKTQTMRLLGRLRLGWDTGITWEPDEYCGHSQIELDPKNAGWQPSFFLENSAQQPWTDQTAWDSAKPWASADGWIQYTRHVDMEVACLFDFGRVPYDYQTCTPIFTTGDHYYLNEIALLMAEPDLEDALSNSFSLGGNSAWLPVLSAFDLVAHHPYPPGHRCDQDFIMDTEALDAGRSPVPVSHHSSCTWPEWPLGPYSIPVWLETNETFELGTWHLLRTLYRHNFSRTGEGVCETSEGLDEAQCNR